jgi:hypothetical protein
MAQKLLTLPAIRIGAGCVIILVAVVLWAPTTGTVSSEGDRGTIEPIPGQAGHHLVGLTPPSSEAEPACPEGVDPGWWGRVQDDIARSEYDIRWQEGVGAYQSPNRAQNLRFTYRGDGFMAEPRAHGEEDSPWKLGMRLSAWGREEQRKEFRSGELQVDGDRATAEGEGVALTYRNGRKGMRQDFLVRERPAGSGPLRLWLELELEGVVADVEPDGREVSFGRDVAGGARVMSYGDLKVTDAAGRLLEAEVVREGEDLYAIVVDDADAVYPVLVDPLSSSPDWTAESDQANAWFGYSVATAGDVNGDGYSDVIVGAPDYDNGQVNEGRAFVYLGGPTGPDESPVWTAESDQAGAQFGYSAATAGDVNGDGYSDVIVGAYWYDNSQPDEGRAFVYLGGPSGPAASPIWTAESDQAYALFGVRVATAGDVNGDGYSDVIVGACEYDNGETNEGRAYVYLGGPTGLAASPVWTAESDQAHALFGWSVAGAGDVNGDGYSDVIVGARMYDNGETNEGRAYVYLGGPSGPAASPDWTAESDQTNAWFGCWVGGAGDVNGDGYSDVIVGACYYDNGEVNEGRAFVYTGGPLGLDESPDWTAESDQAEAAFGFPVGGAGDVNGDGYSDVIVCASYYDNGETDEGRAYVYLGGPTGPDDSPVWTAESDQASALFGYSAATAGDVNGDGYSDVIVGAYSYDNGETDEGQAYVYFGGPSGPAASAVWTAEGNLTDASLGHSVATAGDVNGDGYSDVIVGAPHYDNGETYEGRAFVYLGGATGLAATPVWTAESDQAYAQFGLSVATAGDVNGDGYSDVIVGADLYDNGQTDEGGAFVYLGGPTGPAATPVWTAESDQANANFGFPVATAGDVNGDGYSDVIVGAQKYDNGQTDEGRAFVYLGSPSGPAASPVWTAEGDQADARFGRSVATAGDVNGDGYSDVIVGAELYDNDETNEGRAYVYLGGPIGPAASPHWTAEGDQAGAWFGSWVAGAGDVNGDGYSDVIVSACCYDNGEPDEGRAFVYTGGPTGLDESADWTAESDQAGAYFGYPVTGAGDVNGDGYSDVSVGAAWYDDGETDEGRAYVYLGGPTGPDESPDWTAEGDQASAYFGYSVATAGDVNGDGYSDVIVGAYLYDNGQGDEGRAYVYYGNEGDGLDVLPRQWRTDLVTPVVPALKTRSQSQAGLGLYGRTFFGRNDLRVQFEVKPLGTAFDGTGLVTTAWLDPGTTGASVSEIVGGLSDETMYRWRARVGYRLSDGAPQPFGRWVYQPYTGGLGEADFQVGDVMPPDAPDLHINELSATQCRLWWHPVAGATSYTLYRGTSAFFAPGTPWQTVAAPDTVYDFSDGVGNAATNYYFLCRSVGAGGESGDSDRVGEFDFGTATALGGKDASQAEVERPR